MSIVWEDPPAAAQTNWKSVVEELKKHPERWAKVSERDFASVGTRIRRDYPGLEIKTVRAGLGYPKGRADIYARWVGESDG